MPGLIKPVRIAEIYNSEYYLCQGTPKYTPRIRDMVHFSKEALEKLKTFSPDNGQFSQEQPKREDNDLHKSYSVLDLEQNATSDEIRRAYREAIKKYHPDKFSSLPLDIRKILEEKAKEINTAYDKLKSQ